MFEITPSAGYTQTLRLHLAKTPGTLGRLTMALGEAGGDIEAVDIVEHRGGVVVRDVSVKCRDELHGEEIVRAAGQVPGVTVHAVTDRTFDLHRGGKLAIAPRVALKTRDGLAMAYTPGVGRVSQAIADDPELVWDFTGKRSAVAVLSDGSAVLGLGDIGPEAALPVMEGKALLFKEFAGIDAYPVCVHTAGPDELVAIGKAIAPGFAGINLEDIAAPACFEVEERLEAELDIPVFHDDQHGTAIVVLAAVINGARVVGKRLEDLTVAFLGMGAAGTACARLLLVAGVGDVLGCDRAGILFAGQPGLSPQQRWIAEHSNPGRRTGTIADALEGADVFVGVSGPRAIKPEWVARMADDALVYPMANPIPEIMPEEMPKNVRVVATGRSDYPNQINNVLAFPGIFRGLLDCRAAGMTDGIKLAAAQALADLVADDQRAEDYIMASPFDRRVVGAVAAAVQQAATDAGLARRPLVDGS